LPEAGSAFSAERATLKLIKTNVLERIGAVTGSDGPTEIVMQRVASLYALVEDDTAFVRLRRLMEVDWTEADATVEAVGLPPLLQGRARKLASLAAGIPSVAWADMADAIRYTERHDEIARTALWWLGFVASRAVGSGQ
jgi:hypothetical protein